MAARRGKGLFSVYYAQNTEPIAKVVTATVERLVAESFKYFSFSKSASDDNPFCPQYSSSVSCFVVYKCNTKRAVTLGLVCATGIYRSLGTWQISEISDLKDC